LTVNRTMLPHLYCTVTIDKYMYIVYDMTDDLPRQEKMKKMRL